MVGFRRTVHSTLRDSELRHLDGRRAVRDSVDNHPGSGQTNTERGYVGVRPNNGMQLAKAAPVTSTAAFAADPGRWTDNRAQR